MNPQEVEVLFVEDNPHDAELTMRALRQHKLANHIVHLKDGAQALAWLFEGGASASRGTARIVAGTGSGAARRKRCARCTYSPCA